MARSSLCRFMTKVNFLLSIAWEIGDFVPHSLHQRGRSCGSTLQRRNIAYLQSCDTGYFPLMMEVGPEIQVPVLITYLRWFTSVGRSFTITLASTRMELVVFHFQISAWPTLIIIAWYPDQKYVRPQRAVTRCLVSTHDIVQFSGSDRFGSGNASKYFFTVSLVTFRHGIYASAPLNIFQGKIYKGIPPLDQISLPQLG